jgi:hypothetical protein
MHFPAFKDPDTDQALGLIRLIVTLIRFKDRTKRYSSTVLTNNVEN